MVADGVQLSWKGEPKASYVITVLSATAPPRNLPAAQGTSALVPGAGTPGGPGQCFTVAAAPAKADGDPGPASDAACVPGVTADQMQTGK